jgi:hypothetical protein
MFALPIQAISPWRNTNFAFKVWFVEFWSLFVVIAFPSDIPVKAIVWESQSYLIKFPSGQEQMEWIGPW